LYAKMLTMPRLLLIKTSSLGDIIHNLPAITDIRAHSPDMEIDWVVEESFADIPRLHPAVNSIVPIAIRRWRRTLFSKKTWQEIIACKRKLRAKSYDFVLDTQGLLKSAVISSFAHGARHGQDKSAVREPIAARFYQHKHLLIPRGQHAVVRNRQLAAMALGYPMPDTAPDYGIQAANTEPSIALPAAYIVGLHGTSRDSKLWPTQNWITLGKHLSEKGLQLLLPWGNEAERNRATTIAASVPQALILHKLGLSELATVLAGAKAVVGVDTGLAHLAAALKVPTVAIYTDTDPSLTGIYPGLNSAAINLGGLSQMPSPEAVIQALNTITL
jgi:heptosyltransferase-1